MDEPESEWIGHLQQLSPLSAESLALLAKSIYPRELARNEVLLREGQVCREYYLVTSGHVRTTQRYNRRLVSTGFTFEGHFATSLHSLKTETPSPCSLVAGEPTRVWVFARLLFRALCQHRPDILLLSRRILADLHQQVESRASLLNLLNVAERYQHLRNTQPELLRRVTLAHVASYLGSSRETLSRVRARR